MTVVSKESESKGEEEEHNGPVHCNNDNINNVYMLYMYKDYLLHYNDWYTLDLWRTTWWELDMS